MCQALVKVLKRNDLKRKINYVNIASSEYRLAVAD